MADGPQAYMPSFVWKTRTEAASGTAPLALVRSTRADNHRALPTVFAASSFAIAEGGFGCSPSTRAVKNGGPGAAALKYLDEDEEAEDPAPTAEDEKPAPEDDGDEHQAKREACLARLGALYRYWDLNPGLFGGKQTH